MFAAAGWWLPNQPGIRRFTSRARHLQARGVVKALDADNDLRFLRIRTRKHEIMIAPEFDKSGREYYLVVVQEPAAE